MVLHNEAMHQCVVTVSPRHSSALMDLVTVAFFGQRIVTACVTSHITTASTVEVCAEGRPEGT